MMLHDERGFYAAGLGLSLVTAALVAMGFVFLSFMKMTMTERADMELHQEIDDALRMITADAEESMAFSLHDSGGSHRLAFQKARVDAGGGRGVTYGTRSDGARTKLCRSRETVLQPLTGESELGDVTIEEFRAEELRKGCLHIVLSGRSQRTGHIYRQTAEFALEETR